MRFRKIRESNNNPEGILKDEHMNVIPQNYVEYRHTNGGLGGGEEVPYYYIILYRTHNAE